MSGGRVPPGGVLGILGGGQLGRMLALAAARLGIESHIYCPDPDSPAFQVTRRVTCAAYEDETALAGFAADVDAVTYEFENIPPVAAAFLSAAKPVLPDVKALETTADRVTEKTFVRSLGIGTAEFRAVDSRAELASAVGALGRPAVLKTRRFGYDGKGQALIRPGSDLSESLARMGGQPAILEAFVPFVMEVSVVAVRGSDGAVRTYDLIENEHRDHILDVSMVPARVAPEVARQAGAIAARIIAALDYVGVLAVEMFVTRDDDVLVNEIAPRVHNSGHWTEDACLVSQFENHVRAVCGWPLGSTERHSDAVMTNLIGEDAGAWADLAREPGALHLYGKHVAREGRKMGHFTRISPRNP
ncbi:5-(carboxyamino)imidazole ribonucleotide synthase [Labrys wisconsinensis]|uniref:N5-carboxyaminoimidazole ribonucleotide synthase n=1 Tax=Labrys wisconsinensis TaxID=425677 RepID=A0ABU0JD08_9HYPH|nr:5-(carboxyamino)imidazole ribonucleotide synthase [Labrys wisconsinensis]MDQ0471134.1 5-(carboxyamino)imidazole ribonucleotide synthase [Labrys wisconsinensis]